MDGILFLGDLSLHALPGGPSVVPRPSGPDLCVVNFESPITDASPKEGKVRLLATPGAERALSAWPGSVALLANNHINDAGMPAITRTIGALRELGIQALGVQSADRGESHVITLPNGVRVGLLNWVTEETHPDLTISDGACMWPGDANAGERVAKLRSECDWVVVAMHWGEELIPYPSPEDRRKATVLANAGATYVIGSHPHVVRGGERIGPCQVFYSLGNYYFPDVLDPWTGAAIVIQAPLTKTSIGVRIGFARAHHAARVKSFCDTDAAPRIDSRRHGERAYSRLSRPLHRERAAYATWYETMSRRWAGWPRWWHFRRHELALRDVPATVRRLIQRQLRRRNQ